MLEETYLSIQTTQNTSFTIRSFSVSSGIFKLLQLQCKQTFTDSEQQTCSDLKKTLGKAQKLK